MLRTPRDFPEWAGGQTGWQESQPHSPLIGASHKCLSGNLGGSELGGEDAGIKEPVTCSSAQKPFGVQLSACNSLGPGQHRLLTWYFSGTWSTSSACMNTILTLKSLCQGAFGLSSFCSLLQCSVKVVAQDDLSPLPEEG